MSCPRLSPAAVGSQRCGAGVQRGTTSCRALVAAARPIAGERKTDAGRLAAARARASCDRCLARQKLLVQPWRRPVPTRGKRLSGRSRVARASNADLDGQHQTVVVGIGYWPAASSRRWSLGRAGGWRASFDAQGALIPLELRPAPVATAPQSRPTG